MHRKWVRPKCAIHMLNDALVMFQFISFMRASLKSFLPSLKGIKEKRLLGDNPTLLPTVFVCSQD